MGLQQELGLKSGFRGPEHEAILSIYYTAWQVKKKAYVFFRQFGLTDVQFNVLALLCHQAEPEGGISQAQLGEMMLVNRANITSLIDRMEKARLAVRTAAAGDRRYNIIKMTDKGKKLFAKVEPMYVNQIGEVMAPLTTAETKKLITILEKVRSKLG